MKIPAQVKIFMDLYTERNEETGWHVIQAMTLLKVSRERNRLRSFVVYAALEMRQAIEQQMFTIVRLVTKEDDEKELLARCMKKDGLSNELALAEHNYTDLCYLMSVIAEEFPKFPPVGKWDIKQLKQLWLLLSRYCHSPQTLDKYLSDEWYTAAEKAVLQAHNYVFTIMTESKGTGNLDMRGAKPEAKKLCDDFLSGRIKRADLKAAVRELKQQLDSNSPGQGSTE